MPARTIVKDLVPLVKPFVQRGLPNAEIVNETTLLRYWSASAIRIALRWARKELGIPDPIAIPVRKAQSYRLGPGYGKKAPRLNPDRVPIDSLLGKLLEAVAQESKALIYGKLEKKWKGFYVAQQTRTDTEREFMQAIRGGKDVLK